MFLIPYPVIFTDLWTLWSLLVQHMDYCWREIIFFPSGKQWDVECWLQCDNKASMYCCYLWTSKRGHHDVRILTDDFNFWVGRTGNKQSLQFILARGQRTLIFWVHSWAQIFGSLARLLGFIFLCACVTNANSWIPDTDSSHADQLWAKCTSTMLINSNIPQLPVLPLKPLSPAVFFEDVSFVDSFFFCMHNCLCHLYFMPLFQKNWL